MKKNIWIFLFIGTLAFSGFNLPNNNIKYNLARHAIAEIIDSIETINNKSIPDIISIVRFLETRVLELEKKNHHNNRRNTDLNSTKSINTTIVAVENKVLTTSVNKEKVVVVNKRRVNMRECPSIKCKIKHVAKKK